MKKVLCSLIAVLTLFSSVSVVSAANVGDVIGYTMYTDIIASINNHNIESFNIDGYTGVVAEDLRNYGFDVQWVPESKALYITRGTTNTVASTYVAYKPFARFLGNKRKDILFTDIKCYINGTEVQSYNIDGRTIINFNDLQAFGVVTYNNDTRKIDLTVSDGLAVRPDSWYQNLPKITMYAPDGRTIEVFEHEAAAYADAGWESGPTELWSYLEVDDVLGYLREVDPYVVSAARYMVDGYNASSATIKVYNYKYSVYFAGVAKKYLGSAKSLADRNKELPLTKTNKKYSTFQEKIDYAYELCDEIANLEITSSNYARYEDKIRDNSMELIDELIGLLELCVRILDAFFYKNPYSEFVKLF